MLRLLQGKEIQTFIKQLREKVSPNPILQKQVEEIVTAVKERGYSAVAQYCQQFDGTARPREEILITAEEMEEAQKKVEGEVKEALEVLIQRVTAFHEGQVPPPVITTKEDGGEYIGTLIRPLERVGVYVPGGRNPYPSTLPMTIIPAQLAGVSEILVATPPQAGGGLDPYLLYTAKRLGIQEILPVGGAQAIAAMAYGIEGVKPVDKIVGPGNIYVTLAKKILYGTVGIDMLAGPSEIVIIADASAPASFLAADLMAQAEHDPYSIPILISPHQPLLEQVNSLLKKQVPEEARRDVITEAFQKQGRAFWVQDLEEGIGYANDLAPEHLVLMVKNPKKFLPQVTQAGALFLGPYTPQASGDYLAGPSHVIPTGGCCRFSSPLWVEDFLKRTSLISFEKKRIQELLPHGALLAQLEGLQAHRSSFTIRKEE